MKHPILMAMLCAGLLYSCDSQQADTTEVTPPAPHLSDAFADHFTVGTALGGNHIDGSDSLGRALVSREFNTITPENIMKWEVINPAPGVFDWTAADAYVAFGEENDMFIVGHALVWHSQLAEYVKEITGPEELRKAMSDHINAVAGRYKGKVDGWDVVNEALNEDGTMRESVFLKVLGEDFMTESFKMAAAAAPDTELYYNDYNMWNMDKAKGAVRMLQRVQANGARVDGIGMQAHYSVAGPPIEAIEKAIKLFTEAGFKVMITELDVTTLPNPWDLVGAEVSQNFENSPFMNPYPEGLPDSMQTVLANRYADLFKLYLKYSDDIDRITFWGVNDEHSWLNGWPIKDRTNYPLLFDRAYNKKPAYEAVMKLTD